MSTQSKVPKRPKLSLTIKTPNASSPRSMRTLAGVDPKSPTSFNTLTNVYVTAIERSTPVTAVNTLQRLRGNDDDGNIIQTGYRTQAQTPYPSTYPETPLTATARSPTSALEFSFPSIMTATPPLSAGPTEDGSSPKSLFSPIRQTILSVATSHQSTEPRTPKRKLKLSSSLSSLADPPYTHPRTLHSILRNSPLPPRTAKTPMSPRRQSVRLQEKAARRVAYNCPLEQTITTNKYTKSHIDLLIEDASPSSPAIVGRANDSVLDLALAFSGDETRDGGQTPGPFEEMRRRMAGLAAATPLSPSGGIRKRKRKEKKRCWVWTIGQEGEEAEEEMGGAMVATRAAEVRAGSGVGSGEDLPTPSVESSDECLDADMSEPGEFAMPVRNWTPGEFDKDLVTPTLAAHQQREASMTRLSSHRLGSEGLFNPDTGSRRDTPVPPDLMVA